jgi:hypothetical protein
MKLKKLTAAVLSFVMMLGINTAPAFAATSKSASTAITAEVGSGYTVTVPEKIALTSTTTGTGTYTGTIAVNIKGDVAANQTVTVAATAPTMKDTAGNSVAATFTSTPKTKWSRTDMQGNGTTSNYVVSASLTPGSWTGTATFTCTLA